MNYYARQSWSKISLHRDSHEKSLKAKEFWPVVSLSVGDSANFCIFEQYGGLKNPGPATRIKLKSGDVLLFGGDSRLVAHSVEAPTAERPAGLKMVEGRLNSLSGEAPRAPQRRTHSSPRTEWQAPLSVSHNRNNNPAMRGC